MKPLSRCSKRFDKQMYAHTAVVDLKKKGKNNQAYVISYIHYSI